MSDLTPDQETILAGCLQAMEEGQGLEACLARFPQHAQALRPVLHLHSDLLGFDPPEPPALAYETGRSVLLARVSGRAPAHGTAAGFDGLKGAMGSFAAAVSAFIGARNPARMPAMQGAAVALLLLAFGGGALGASAAAGFAPSQAVLSSLGMFDDDKGASETAVIVDEEDEKEESTPEPSKTKEPDEKAPVSVIAPDKSPTPEEQDADSGPEPTDKPADSLPTKQPDRPRPTATRPAPPVPHDPTPIPVDLGQICIPASAYQQYTALHAYDVKICGADLKAKLDEMFNKGLCLPKNVADAFPSLLDIGIKGCSSEQEEAIGQYLFFEGWCAPAKAAELLGELGYNVPACTEHKIKSVLLYLNDNNPCRLDLLLPDKLVC